LPQSDIGNQEPSFVQVKIITTREKLN